VCGSIISGIAIFLPIQQWFHIRNYARSLESVGNNS
jgi:hypothetical protein